MKKRYQQTRTWFLSLPPKKRWALIVTSILLLGFVLWRTPSTTPETLVDSSDIRMVEISSVDNLAENGAPISLSGTVTSRSEANLKTETSGRITTVYKKLGSYVRAGEIIAEIENTREVATLAQARALLAQAKASQNISEITQTNAATLLNETRISVVNTLRNTYDGIEDSIRNKIDPMFSNPQSGSPEFNIKSSNSQLTIDVNFARLKMQTILEVERERKNKLSTENDLLKELQLAENELAEVKKFIDLVNATLNTGLATTGMSQTTIDAYKVVASTARSSWSTLVANISTTKDNLSSKTAQFEISQRQGKEVSGTPTLSQAAIAQAESGVELAESALEKTIIRSPIFGTINSITIEQGDSVSQQEPVATVSNNSALEVITYLSSVESREVALGSKVNIQNIAEGVVTRIAPALDPLTKKIEIRIAVSKGLNMLLNGQSVNLSIARAKTPTKITTNAPISIPIVSLKITPDGPVVFTVEGDTLVSHPVTIGSLLGNRIVVTSGLTNSMQIVTDARGLKDGQKVNIK